MEGVQEIHSLAKYPEPPFLPGSFLGLRLLLLFECIRTALSCPKCSDGNPLFCISSGGSSQSYRGNLWPWMRQVSSAGLDYVGLKWTESLKARAWLVSKSMSFLSTNCFQPGWYFLWLRQMRKLRPQPSNSWPDTFQAIYHMPFDSAKINIPTFAQSTLSWHGWSGVAGINI